MKVSPYTEKRVKHSESYVRSILREDVNPIKNNVENHLDVDIYTDLGMLDVQYTSSDNLYVDYISVLMHKEHCVLPDRKRDHPKFWAQVNAMNKDLKVFQNLGYSLEEILHCLGVYVSKDIKPGKIMNKRYDYVAYVKYIGKTLEVDWVRVLDLNYLRSVPSNRARIAFNLKDKWNSLNDWHHSAYVKFNERDLDKADVTSKFIGNKVSNPETSVVV